MPDTRDPKPEAARGCHTIGALERLAGIGPTEEERFAFWRQFAPLKAGAFAAGRAALYRRIREREAAGNPPRA